MSPRRDSLVRMLRQQSLSASLCNSFRSFLLSDIKYHPSGCSWPDLVAHLGALPRDRVGLIDAPVERALLRTLLRMKDRVAFFKVRFWLLE